EFGFLDSGVDPGDIRLGVGKIQRIARFHVSVQLRESVVVKQDFEVFFGSDFYMKIIVRTYKRIVFELPGVDNISVWSLKPKPVRSIFFLSSRGFDAFVSSFKPSHIELLGYFLTSQRTQI